MTPEINPRDPRESAALGAGQRIASAIAIIATTAPALLALIGGLDWITANLPLLLAGLGSLATGGIASYVAVRRMAIDRPASPLQAPGKEPA